MISIGALQFDTTASHLAPRGDELALFVELVNDVVDFRRTGLVEALDRGHPVRGDLSVVPVVAGLEIERAGRSVVVPSDALAAAIDELSRLRAPARSWLFTAEPVGPRPGPTEADLLHELESAAVALDALEAGGADEAQVSAKRRFLLDDLDLAGILTLRGAEARQHWLERWQLPALLAYQRSALDAWRYYHGAQRAADLTDPVMPARLADGPFALDWFRRPSTPPEPWTFERLTISSELTFKSTFEQPDRAHGTYYFSSGRLRGQYWFRTDFARPALYKAAVTRSST